MDNTRTSIYLGARLLETLILIILGTSQLVGGVPLHLQTHAIDPALDTWAEPIAGIGPLILLIGERSTKQVLQNVRGFHNAFCLAAAPLGLLSLVTNLIRLCGVQGLRAFIGYELEVRAVAGMEVTRVNCAGVHAELVNGYVVRKAAAEPQSKAIAAALLEGDLNDGQKIRKETLSQIKACEAFEREKVRQGIPTHAAPVGWCLGISAETAMQDGAKEAVEVMLDAVDVDSKNSPNTVRRFQRAFQELFPGIKIEPGSPMSLTPSMGHLIFLCTFDAVSEFSTSIPSSIFVTTVIGVLSICAILVIHCLALWSQDWQPSVALILAFGGYIGIVLCVTATVLLIHSSCTCIMMKHRNKTNQEVGWIDGLVMANKNTDSMDTTGSEFLQSPKGLLIFEAVWMNNLTTRKALVSSFVAVLLTACFICHYVGLRSVRWWVSVGELGICILAAFARTVTKEKQERFKVVPGIRIDKRCSSTGKITMQAAEKTEISMLRMDARAYSTERSNRRVPTSAEHIAWHAAHLCIANAKIVNGVMSLTGMMLAVTADSHSSSDGTIAILASFNGGILVSEGLASPNTRLLISFRASPQSLCAPTPLLARAIMRQPQWVQINTATPLSMPVGNVHIPSLGSMMNWWTVSEDRNDMGDLQSNLQWAFLLVNLAFFVKLLKDGGPEVVKQVEAGHERAGSDSQAIAGKVVDRLGTLFQ
jgi:hypothetical protein